jgi:hypothetical protein
VITLALVLLTQFWALIGIGLYDRDHAEGSKASRQRRGLSKVTH